jgi:hypothetical protein
MKLLVAAVMVLSALAVGAVPAVALTASSAGAAPTHGHGVVLVGTTMHTCGQSAGV